MVGSYKDLVTRASRGSERARNELLHCKNLYISTGLVGINGEQVVFRKTEAMLEDEHFILSEIRDISNASSVQEVILLDCFSSATIEGARTTVDNVKKSFSNPRTKDDKMVVNTIVAQNLVYNQGIFPSNIRGIWERLVEGVCENVSVAGLRYRSGDVVVGSLSKVIHVPEKVCNIESKMNMLFNFISSTPVSVIKACVVHFYFVYIHPFCDGNGRFARLWMGYILSQVNNNFKGVSISREINNTLSEYYSVISESEFSYNGLIDITLFIEYMFKCILNAVEYAKYKRYEVLSELEKKVIAKVFKNGSGITVKKLGSILRISDSQARSILNNLVSKRFLVVDKSCKEYRYLVR